MSFMVVSACVFSLGTYLATLQNTRSTYVCFNLVDSKSQTVLLQLLGLVLDAAIVALLWRILAWTRTARLKLRMLGTVLTLSAATVASVWLFGTILGGTRRFNVAFGSLYGFDVLVDSAAFAVLVISASFWGCETSTITPSSVVTFLVGAWTSAVNVLSLGDWAHGARAGSLVPVWLIAFGAVLFTYTHDVRSIIFMRRIVLTIFFMALIIATTVITFTKRLEVFDKRHPINDLIYEAQTKHERWLVGVTTSKTLPAAIKIYEERHPGKAAPPNFDQWYQFASGSPIVDEFAQIDRDLKPFWNLSPQELRKRVAVAARQDGIAAVTIQGGQVTGSDTGNDGDNQDLDEVVKMIDKFSQYIPDMVLPINLSPTPRILPSWQNVQLGGHADMSYIVDLVSKRSRRLNETTSEHLDVRDEQAASDDPSWGLNWASDFRQSQIDACPPNSPVRSSPHWKIGEFCHKCVQRHSHGQFLSHFESSLQVCEQPDLMHLHAFSMTNPRSAPIKRLLPLFGPSKTDSFKDVLIPIPKSRLLQPDSTWHFPRRYDSLFWRGSAGNQSINDQVLRGSHKFRLLHLVKQPDPQDEVRMVLPTPGKADRFRTERVTAAEASNVMPFAVGIDDYSACQGRNCDLLKHTFGTEAATEEPMEYRYVLLTDEDGGPPLQMLRTMKSGSVPFVSTMFRTWYTERIQPWLHFVPIDVRYHALHTTLSYFTGTEDRPKINGRDTALRGRISDAEWISQQGQRWAAKALDSKDMELYLFRLLLEWGRLIDDRRGEIGYRKGQNGEFENIGWTRHRDEA
ncbi:glycosyltransferase family 90 protein [Purpureocillium lavendulum]|uniref:Glycosyltransferase family 90 protein n=1 Tax=Purpureocillium lavendulum TaxID=1247861 RepID=A0AB34FVC7_9HYPO|nr:glycosyltransferase family 90 protein [Purpureocillium lavendulum]